MAAGLRLLAEPVDPMEGGVSVSDWVEMWYDTHAGNGMGGVTRIEWPDGGAYLSQPAIAVAMLSLVGAEIVKQAQEERGGDK